MIITVKAVNSTDISGLSVVMQKKTNQNWYTVHDGYVNVNCG